MVVIFKRFPIWHVCLQVTKKYCGLWITLIIMKRSKFNNIFMTNFSLILFSTLHPRGGLRLLRTFPFLCSTWGFNRSLFFSKDSDLILRNLLFISFGKSLSKSSNYESIIMFPTQLSLPTSDCLHNFILETFFSIFRGSKVA